MSADFRYMKRPRQTWFLVYTIPPDLRGHPRLMTSAGRPMDKITESLGTKDPDKAREVRNQRIVYWDRQFRMLRHGPSEEDMQEEAAEVYKATLKAEAARPPTQEQGQGWVVAQLKQAAAEAGVEFNSRFKELETWLNAGPAEKYHLYLDHHIMIHAAAEIADYCKRSGIKLEPGTEPYRDYGIRILKAKIAAGAPGVTLPLPDGRQIRGSEQHLPPLPKIEPPIPSEPKPITDPPPPKKGTETFADAAAVYLKTELDEDVKPATVEEYRRKIAVFPHKDMPLRSISRGMAADFLDGLVSEERGLSRRTRNLYASLFSSIYKSAIRREKATMNPFDGQRVKAAVVHYEPFTDEEITKLFASATFEIAPAKHTTATALPWCALISAFTGCRRDEIARLTTKDIKRTGDVWYFDVCADGDGKTENAERVVPLHHVLLDAGLLQYRDALPAGSRLFPSLKAPPSAPDKMGKALGYAFEAWRKRLGINREGVNFHSFRHCVGDRLRKAGVAKDDRGFLLGHADVETQNKVYGHDGPGLHRLQAIVDKINYRGWAPGAVSLSG
jgi:integrase